MKFAFLIQNPGLGGLASMHERLEETLESHGHSVDKFIVQKEDVIHKIKEKDYDVVHLYFTPFLDMNLFLRLMKFNLFSDTQVFVNYYNIKPENILRRIAKRTFLPLLCDKVVLPSKNMESFYLERIGINNTATLHPIVEDKFYKIDNSGDKIIYFGHAREDKGIDRILDLASKKEPIHCYFIQDDNLVYELFPEIEEKVKNEEIILHDELPEVALSEAKLALFPFHNMEKTVDIPLALIESLTAGVPVLVSNISPVNELVSDKMLVDDWSTIDLSATPQSVKEEKTKKFRSDVIYNDYMKIIGEPK